MQTTILTVLLSVFTLTSKAQQVNFSGSWRLDTGKSQFGNVASRAAIQHYKIAQSEKYISLEWITLDENNKETVSTQKLPLDNTNASALLPSKRTRSATASFSKDGKELTLTKSYSKIEKAEEVDYTIVEKWQLAGEGKELVIELTSPAYVIKAVYDKVK